jgi:EAL domain-containing protein (putative c-di-GMP-specific phosphodiesterase class I)
VIKLDMALTRDVHIEPTRRALVEFLASACRVMNVSVVAEGVESEAERDELASAGCDLFQGFLFGRPDPGLLDPAGFWSVGDATASTAETS